MILVINCGSSSLKYELYQMPEGISQGGGTVERIGLGMGSITQVAPDKTSRRELEITDHGMAMSLVFEALGRLIDNMGEITGVGHRVVHGGEHYNESVIIDHEVLQAIKENTQLAPLHNPANLTGVREAAALFPHLKQIAVFDTAFHQTIPPAAYLYGLPREFYEKFKIRRYGFHGTSHRFVNRVAVEYMKRAVENTNVISCHLGNGASITAIAGGKSLDTSMGFTPLEGLVMGTRCGDIDPAIIFFLLEQGYTPEGLNALLNKKSGVYGLSGISNDFRDLEAAVAKGDKIAEETLDVFAHRVRHYIGSYMAELVKVDLLLFTGGIGEHDLSVRERICCRLENLGIIIDVEKNRANGSKLGIISTDYSPVSILVVPTNEELQIAIDTYRLISA